MFPLGGLFSFPRLAGLGGVTPPMRIKLLLFAGCREAVGTKELEIELPEAASTVEKALEEILDRFPQLRGIAKSVAIARNGEVRGRGHSGCGRG